ncbi:MAG TPA: hypothetical protein VK483_18305 [Chitinophagaceae bacterium]|nr:hypothetical protein [Chitinophagaceae bacterium]
MKKRLLPPVFKMVGIAIILLSLIILFLARALNIVFIRDIISHDKELFSQIGRSVFFTGFLFILLAREKVEDEFADFCRLTAFRITFVTGLIAVILNSIPILNNKNIDNSYHFLLIECIFYIIFFYATKKGLIRYEK